jgi:FkbM family methyltransferase
VVGLIIPDGFDLESSHSYRKIYIEGMYEEIPFGQSDVVVDVGANIGVFAEYVLKKNVGKIIGIEPCTDNVSFLRQNCPPIAVYECGAWDVEDALEFYYYAKFRGMSHFAGWNGFIPELPRVEKVKVCPLDVLLEEERIDFINMDIEGAELKALAGAKKTIVKYKPALLIAVYHRANDAVDIPDMILDLVPEYRVEFLGSSQCKSALFYL